MYTYLELCAGCGGLSYGLDNAGLKPSGLIEIEKNCVDTLKLNFKNTNIIHDDLRNVDYSDFNVSLLCSGIPCQSFSTAGKKESLNNENKGGLFYNFFNILKELKPNMFLVENVEGLVHINNGKTLKFIITKLTDIGYNVEYKILNAVDYYVPQKRKRLFIIGILKKYKTKFEWPKPKNTIMILKDVLKNVPKSNGQTYSDNKKK